MKDLSLLVWLTQLGLSVVSPMIVFLFLALWLQKQYALGAWVFWVGVALGSLCAISGFRQCLQLMEQITRRKDKQQPKPPVGFNDHT